MANVFEQLFPIPADVTHDTAREALLAEVKQCLDKTESYEHLDALPEREREQAVFRWRVLSRVTELCHGVFSEQRLKTILPELESEFAALTPSISTIRRWAKVYQESGRSIKALAPNSSGRGNKSKRLNPEMEELIQQALDRIKDAKSGAVSSAYSYLQHLVFQYNQRSDLKLRAPSIQTFWARFKKISPYEMAVKQKGKFKANKEFKHIGEMVKTNRLLERVEIDHTKLDFFVVEKESFIPLGRPWITTLCDVHSLSALGFYIGFTPPSFVAVARALKHALLPKDYVLRRYPEIKNTWPCFGKPELIVSDNGKEFDDKDFKLVLGKLLINSGKNPTATPYLKPIIERHFGKLNSELLRAQPGHTLASLKGSADYDPAKTAVVDMDRLLQIIHIWICDIYQAGPNAKRDRIPNHTWKKAFEKFAPVQTEYDVEDLNLTFCRALSGQLRRDGVTFRHLRYSSHALAELRAKVGDHQVIFKVDPENLGYIYVSNQVTQSFLKVPAVKFEYASSVTLHQHKINCIAARQEVGDSYCDDDIQEANSRIHQLVDEAFSAKARSSKRTGRTSKAARYVEDSKRAKALATEKQDEVVSLTSDSNAGDEPKKIPSKPVDTTGWEFL
ncbi:Mu transposase C-terminal domain-containing protein [Arsukibacterium sp.]|uniref:Mu transposase C-terminal domain-containing protein n=1 Tax=Arsukibacterium sp. TaxID=1977258 RepID=UPI00299EC7C9|nr:Mu transposase C-terminal domain-containing protein [Arsukibacterium sp.]MDX1539584.1 Mu transposase C-terminal domain-containing protein [Arsukibacterium sp.]